MKDIGDIVADVGKNTVADGVFKQKQFCEKKNRLGERERFEKQLEERRILTVKENKSERGGESSNLLNN